MLAWPWASWGVGGYLVHVHVASVPTMRRAANPYVRRPRNVSALRELCPRRSSTKPSLLSAARPAVRVLPARAASRLRVRRAYLLRLRLLFFVLRLLGSAREAVRGRDDRTAGADRGQPRHRGSQQRRLPPPALPGGGHPGARGRAGRERGRGGAGQGHQDRGPVPGRRDRPRDRGQYGRADLVAGEQRLRPRAGHPGLRGRAASPGQGRRHGDAGVPAPAAADRAPAVRHDLPRALLLPVPADLVRALATAGLRVVDVDELDTHGGSLRVYARPEESAGEPAERVKAVLAEEEAAGLHTVAGP